MQQPNKNDKSKQSLKIIAITGAAVLLVRLLMWTDSFHSALLYIAVPLVFHWLYITSRRTQKGPLG